MSADYKYIGEELDVFAAATNWKNYLRQNIAPYLKGDVLEVGAGIGGTTRVFFKPEVNSWTCLEPDGGLLIQLTHSLKSLPQGAEKIRAFQGTLDALDCNQCFDAILYIDVLEHIEDDRSELRLAVDHLKPEGRVIVLSPAIPFLYSPFDKEIGHYRRYTASMYRTITGENATLEHIRYLDSVGLLASLANRLLLRSAKPTRSQVLLWDRAMVPISRYLDKVTFHQLGKSVLGIWRKAAPT